MIFAASSARAAEPSGIKLKFHPVGTPTFMGPPRIGKPCYVDPIAETIIEPKEAMCLAGKYGEYEFLIEADGSVSSVTSHAEPVRGDQCEATHLFPYVLKWRLKPATFEGRPIPVYVWLGLNL